MTARNGSADWHGDVKTGSGTITVGDGVFSGPYSYDSRFGEHQCAARFKRHEKKQPGYATMRRSLFIFSLDCFVGPAPIVRWL